MLRAVVVADDEQVTRTAWRALAVAGFQVRIADVAELTAPMPARSEPALIVLALTNQGERAVATVAAVAAARPRAAVLAIDLSDAAEPEPALIAAGAAAVLPRSRADAELASALGRAIRGTFESGETMAFTPTPDQGQAAPVRLRSDDAARQGSRPRAKATPGASLVAANDSAGTGRGATGRAERGSHDAALLRIALRTNASAPNEADAVATLQETISVLAKQLQLDVVILMRAGSEPGGDAEPRCGAIDGAWQDAAGCAPLVRQLGLDAIGIRRGGRDSLFFDSPDQLDAAAAPVRHGLRALGLRSLASVPLVARGASLGRLVVARRPEESRWSDADRRAIEVFADLAAALLRRASEGSAPVVPPHDRAPPEVTPGAVAALAALGSELVRTLGLLDAQLHAMAVDGGVGAEVEALGQTLHSARLIASHLHAFDPQAPARMSALRLNDCLFETAPLLRATAAGVDVQIVADATSDPWVLADSAAVHRTLAEAVLLGREALTLRGVRVRSLEGTALGIELALLAEGPGLSGGSSGALVGQLTAWCRRARRAGMLADADIAPGEARLRLMLAPAPARASHPAPSAASAAIGARLLVVEDEPLLRRLMVRTLTRVGYIVHEAATAEQALALCETATEPYRLLLADVCLPRLSGPGLARTLQDRGILMPALFISGYADDVIVRRDLGRPAPLLAKPFRHDELRRAVQKILADAP